VLLPAVPGRISDRAVAEGAASSPVPAAGFRSPEPGVMTGALAGGVHALMVALGFLRVMAIVSRHFFAS